MITQYSEYSSISADIQNIVANSVSLLDQYVLMQTGENEFTALIKNVANKKVEKIIISRTSSGYNNRFNVVRVQTTDFSHQVTNEYYTFSNIGFGKSLDIPSYDGVLTYSVASLTVVVFLAILFKGVLFKCLKPKK